MAKRTEPFNRERTEAERRFLEAAAELRAEKKPYCHNEMKRRLGKRSVNAVWEMYERLVRDGFIAQEAQVVVKVTAPTLTSKALRYLKAA